jgi:hypothetical protein
LETHLITKISYFLSTVGEGDLGHKGDLGHCDKNFSINLIFFLTAKNILFGIGILF